MSAFPKLTVDFWASENSFDRSLAFVLTALVITAIAILSLAPVSGPGLLPGTDKIYHLVSYAALALPSAVLYPRALALVFPFAILFGGAIEIIQPAVGRSGERLDFYADVAGVCLGALLGLCARGMLRVIKRGANGT